MTAELKKLDIIKLNQLIKDKAGSTQLLEWYSSSCIDAVTTCRYRIMNILLDMNCLSASVQVLKDLPEDIESGILRIRYYLANGNIDAADTYYSTVSDPSLLRKRHARLLMDALLISEQYERAYKYYNIIQTNYVVDGTDVYGFLHPNVSSYIQEKILDSVVGQPIMVNQPPNEWGVTNIDSCKEDPGLTLINFTTEQVDTLMDNINKVFKIKGQQVIIDLDRHYDFIVDGANVLYYIDRKVTANGYRRITRILDALDTLRPGAKILLVLHCRHFAPKAKWKQVALTQISEWTSRLTVDICQTPYNFNDDYFSLLNAFPRPQSLLVTNDQFRDHVFKLSKKDHNLDLIAQWRQEKVIEYDMGGKCGPVTLMTSVPYSYRVQKIDNTYYLPCSLDHGKRNNWLKIPLKK